MISAKAVTTTGDTVYKEPRRSIIRHQRKPGDRLDVEQRAGEHATRITPIRDALQMPNQSGLVTIRPLSGCFVTILTLKQLKDAPDLCDIAEPASIEGAAQRVIAA